MNPDQSNNLGPIELKPGESAHLAHREEILASARSLIEQLPDVHEAKTAEVAPTQSPVQPISEPAAPAHTIANNPINEPVAPVKIVSPLETPVEPVASKPTPTMAEQRAATPPLITAAPVSPSRPAAVVARATNKVADAKRRIPSPVQPILIAVATFSLLLFLFKLPVVVTQVKYALQKPVATLPKAGPIDEVVPQEPTITIPKINIHAPVVYEPSVAEADVQKALESGIDHYGNTPVPGQNGNSVFFGHSSNDWWEPGNYKFVFILLDKLVVGDKFSIDYQGKRYVYQVTGSKVVEPTDLSVLAQTSKPTVTLITCTPPGTSWKRLVVTADQIQPDPSGAQVATNQPTANPATLPGNSTGVGNKLETSLTGFWGGVKQFFSTKPEVLESNPSK